MVDRFRYNANQDAGLAHFLEYLSKICRTLVVIIVPFDCN
jgi:hypothetical protein